MRASWILLLAAAALAAVFGAEPLPAQYDAAIFGSSSPVLLFDSRTGRVTSVIPQPVPQPSRGGTFGPRGLIHVGAWRTSGIDVLDPRTGGWITSLQVSDPTNLVMGAPYQPAPNYDNLGGFGLFCVDGNSPPSPPGPPQPNPPTHRSTFVVDYSTTPPTFAMNGWFWSYHVPMSDMYANLFQPDTFVGVGFHTADLKVDAYPLVQASWPPPTTIAPVNLASLPLPSRFDATWLEDGNLHVLADHAIQIVDPRSGSAVTIALSGVPASHGAIWGAPWERPGMRGWIVSQDDLTIYAVDLLQAPLVATSLVKLPVRAPYFVNSAREAEECQLSSWNLNRNGARNFHLSFGPALASQPALLLPSLAGLRSVPLLLGGLEIYLAIDTATLLGLQGLLPYAPMATLDAQGEADIVWRGVGLPLAFPVYWQALAFRGGSLADASNIINVAIR